MMWFILLPVLRCSAHVYWHRCGRGGGYTFVGLEISMSKQCMIVVKCGRNYVCERR